MIASQVMRMVSRASQTASFRLGLAVVLALVATPILGQEIFTDGFESGDLSEWASCDPDGTYELTSPDQISYTCCLGLVTLTIDSFLLTNDGKTVQSSPSNPRNLSGPGATCPVGSIAASATDPGGCTIGYSLMATFVDADSWEGDYLLTFTGSDCDCFGGLGTPCMNQTFPVSATR